jgi:hypothetical protein
MMGYFILIGIMAAGVLYIISKYLRNVQPFDREIEEDIKIMRESLVEFKEGCIAFSPDNLEVMAFTNADEVKVKAGVTYIKGVFASDKAEPIIAYLYKKYIGLGQNALLYALNDKHEFVFRINNMGTKIFINGTQIGTIRKDFVLHDTKFNKPIAHIQENVEENTSIIYIGTQYAGRIPLFDTKSNSIMPPGSAAPLVSELSKEDSLRFQALAIWDLVRRREG